MEAGTTTSCAAAVPYSEANAGNHPCSYTCDLAKGYALPTKWTSTSNDDPDMDKIHRDTGLLDAVCKLVNVRSPELVVGMCWDMHC